MTGLPRRYPFQLPPTVSCLRLLHFGDPARKGDCGPRGAVLIDADAERASAVPGDEARELPQRVHYQRDHLLVRHGMIDLYHGPIGREVHHAALENPLGRF